MPESALEGKRPVADAEFDSHMSSGAPIFIYVHGSGATR